MVRVPFLTGPQPIFHGEWVNTPVPMVKAKLGLWVTSQCTLSNLKDRTRYNILRRGHASLNRKTNLEISFEQLLLSTFAEAATGDQCRVGSRCRAANFRKKKKPSGRSRRVAMPSHTCVYSANLRRQMRGKVASKWGERQQWIQRYV